METDRSFRPRSDCIEFSLNADHHRYSGMELKHSRTLGSFDARSYSLHRAVDILYVEEGSVCMWLGWLVKWSRLSLMPRGNGVSLKVWFDVAGAPRRTATLQTSFLRPSFA
jgi:hypothetical protein